MSLLLLKVTKNGFGNFFNKEAKATKRCDCSWNWTENSRAWHIIYKFYRYHSSHILTGWFFRVFTIRSLYCSLFGSHYFWANYYVFISLEKIEKYKMANWRWPSFGNPDVTPMSCDHICPYFRTQRTIFGCIILPLGVVAIALIFSAWFEKRAIWH